jgi:hypothetical protein
MRVVGLLLLTLLAACNKQQALSRLVPPADQARAAHYVDLLRARQLDAIEEAADPSIRTPQLKANLEQLATVLPRGTPASAKLVGAQVAAMPEGTRTDVVFEYEYSRKWFLANVVTLRKGDAVTLLGLNVRSIPESLEQRHGFGLRGKSAVHYVVLALAVLFPLLTVYALAACARTKMRGRKWPWMIFILFGVGTFAINWTTGDVQIWLLSFQLFSASATAALYGPWIVSVSLPVGALVFLLRRRALAAVESPAPAR